MFLGNEDVVVFLFENVYFIIDWDCEGDEVFFFFLVLRYNLYLFLDVLCVVLILRLFFVFLVVYLIL